MGRWLKEQWRKWNTPEYYEDDPNSYAYAMSPYKLMWFFIIGSVAGCLIETVWYYFLRGHFVRRTGVVIGPFMPLYGVALAGFSFALYRIRKTNALHLFLISAVLGGALEFAASWLMEVLFGTKAWDYSHKAFNIQGRVSLEFMVYWGMLGVLLIKHTYPFLSKCIESVKHIRLSKILATVLFVFLVFDCLLSISVSGRQAARKAGIMPHNQIEVFFDEYYTDERLAKIFTEIRAADAD